MLAKLASKIPEGPGWLYEPKWDGFRALVFRDGVNVHLQSRDGKPLNRYFPELVEPIMKNVPDQVVLDGEIVIATNDGLDFEALLLRIHPAASRVALLASQAPASFVAWDLLALGARDLRSVAFAERRQALEQALGPAQAPIHLTPATHDLATARDWFARFEGAGLDGVIAKRLTDGYQSNVRAMIKVKHARTADCVVGGFRWHKNGPQTMVGSLLLGLYDGDGVLHHVGITASFTTEVRKRLVEELAPLRANALVDHPWRAWRMGDNDNEGDGGGGGGGEDGTNQRMPGASSRWNRKKDLSWEPLRIERVCEVGYDHLQGDRFRHATQFRRWRPDKPPGDCRYDQLETSVPFALADIFR
ncbi:MAG: ATP-dependent DNA ligase [Deltaproteobacteria bacterium]|nr:ATP-dependent DNA ligase [Deltaproteobacteria bacterium]